MRLAAAGLLWLVALLLGIWMLQTVRLTVAAPSLRWAVIAIGLGVLLVCAAGLCVLGGLSLWYTAALERRLDQQEGADAR